MKKIDKMMKRLINDWFLSPAQARAIETFLTTTLASFVVFFADNLNLMIGWEILDFKNALIVFIWGIIASTQMGIQKYMRDSAKKLLKSKK